MGYIEIIRPDGTGFSSKDSEELEFTQFWLCDRCQDKKDVRGGRNIYQGDEIIMWWCKECL